jgi:hypothetical protein
MVARQTAAPRPSWCAIFTRAYALVAAQHAQLRRAYQAFPTPHLHEHQESVAAIAVERQYKGEDAVFFANLRFPDQRSLLEIEAKLRRSKEDPVESIASFRRGLLVSRLPRPLRRMIWWAGLNVFRKERARCFGTFGVTETGSFGANLLNVQSPLTTTLHYGVIDADGCVDVRLAFDHRVLDGGTAARAMAELEAVLLGQIVQELADLQADDKSDAMKPRFKPFRSRNGRLANLGRMTYFREPAHDCHEKERADAQHHEQRKANIEQV